jgi:hypothetical protein
MITKSHHDDHRFSEQELMPSTGEPFASFDAAKRAELGARVAQINAIFVPNPQHRSAFEALDQLMSMGAGLRGTRQYALRITGASGTGKTTVCEHFRRAVAAREDAPGKRPVVRVELEQACTVKRLWTAVLAAYGDDFRNVGDEEQLRRRAFDAIEAAGTRLLIIDETQHLFYRSKGGSFPTDAIKRALDAGVLPIALAGNEDARTLLESNVQLVNRMTPPRDILPYAVSDAEDRAAFAGWATRFDAALVREGLFGRPSGLDEQRTLACLMELSAGYVGRAANLIRVAATHAFGRDAEFVETFDLATACSEWALAQRLASRNPFRHGISAA